MGLKCHLRWITEEEASTKEQSNNYYLIKIWSCPTNVKEQMTSNCLHIIDCAKEFTAESLIEQLLEKNKKADLRG